MCGDTRMHDLSLRGEMCVCVVGEGGGRGFKEEI